MPDTAVLQLLAYATLTFGGLCIASTALLFSYRQNYGWSPVTLITSHGLGAMGGDDDYIAYLDFEFWNRRKYPVALRSVEVDFGKLRLHEKVSASGERLTWDIFHGKAISRLDIRVDPSGHYQFKCKGAFPKRSIDDLDVVATISIVYFDPVANINRKTTLRYKYSFRIDE